MNKIICLLFCLISFNVIAQKKKVVAKNRITYLKMERTPCYGRCPTYSVEFLKSGEVIYTGKRNTKMIGTYRARMTKSQTSSFFRQFEKYNYSRLAAKYPVMATDLPGMNITIVVGGKTKSVKHAEAGPSFFRQIGADVDEKVKSLKWTADYVEPQITEAVIEAPVEEMGVEEEPQVFEYVERMPEFPGGDAALKSFLNKNINYPVIAKDNGIQGKVICRFVVDKTGNVTNVQVERGIGYGCDDEAMRVLKMMPRWTPGMQNGKAVNVSYILPVFFKLQ